MKQWQKVKHGIREVHDNNKTNSLRKEKSQRVARPQRPTAFYNRNNVTMKT